MKNNHHQNNPDRNLWETLPIRLDAKVGIFPKQSTRNQERNRSVSLDSQTADLLAFAHTLGWTDDCITLFTEDAGMPERARINQRERLLTLIQKIEADKMKTVITTDEDRFFRNTTLIEVERFILVCQKQNVFVITPGMTYDFTNPQHVQQFRWERDMAYRFQEYISTRLHTARARSSSRGQYDGRSLSIGFIVDRRECIDGEKNPNFKKWMPYEPHAAVVRHIFSRFFSLGGKTKELYTELAALPVLFPSFDNDVDPRNAAATRLRQVAGGYHISYNSLVHLLTNVVYIGWWPHKGTYIKGNHPALIAEDVFWFAYNSLSPASPEGEEHTPETSF